MMTREEAIQELKEAGWKEGEDVCFLDKKRHSLYFSRDSMVNVWYSWENAIKNVMYGFDLRHYK